MPRLQVPSVPAYPAYIITSCEFFADQRLTAITFQSQQLEARESSLGLRLLFMLITMLPPQSAISYLLEPKEKRRGGVC